MVGSNTKLAYEGELYRIELYVSALGVCPAELWLESLSESRQHKFAALFAWMGDHGEIRNERKFKHLTNSDQIFEFKVEEGRVLCFFSIGRRLILTHGFFKRAERTSKGEILRAHRIKKDCLMRENK